MKVKGALRADRMRAYADKQKRQVAKQKPEQLDETVEPGLPVVIGFEALCESYGGKKKVIGGL